MPESGWRRYSIWWAMMFVRQMDRRIQEKDERIARLEADVQAWQDKFLLLSNLKPLHHKTSPPPTANYRAPIGPTDKQSMLAQQAAERALKAKPTEDEVLGRVPPTTILEAANRANGSK